MRTTTGLNRYQRGALEVQVRDLGETLLQICRFIRETRESSLLIHYQPVAPAASARLEICINRRLAKIALLIAKGWTETAPARLSGLQCGGVSC